MRPFTLDRVAAAVSPAQLRIQELSATSAAARARNAAFAPTSPPAYLRALAATQRAAELRAAGSGSAIDHPLPLGPWRAETATDLLSR